MAKKNSAGSGLIVGAALIIGLLASIPKEIWIGLIVLAIVVWIVLKFTKTKDARQDAASLPKPAPVQVRTTTPARSVTPQAPASSNSAKQPETFATVTVTGAHGSDGYRIPMPPAGAQPKMRWILAGETVTVAGVSVPGGMIYVGTGLKSGCYDVDPALINPSLKVSTADVDINLALTDYWPSYSSISPDARKGYLQWHSSERKAPQANIGYVFLFFYGLERRVLLDVQTDPVAKADIPAIAAEVQRLLDIYGGNNSFRNYASQFLSYIVSAGVSEKSYLRPPPVITEYSFVLPLPLRVGLGQLAVDQKPVPADWALAWSLADPNISRRTAATRCADLFASLFMQRYAEVYGEGFVLKVNRTKLKVSYTPASAGLRSFDFTRTIGDLPDVSAVKTPVAKLQELVNECTAALDPYSRYIGRHPDKAQALEGLLQLPAELWPAPVRAELDDLKKRVGDGLILMSFGELSGRLKSAGGLTRDKVLGLARALENLHLGLEPDILAGAKTPKVEDKIALFATHPEDGAVRAGPAYSAAAVTLDLACVAALADGETSAHELLHITKQVDSWTHLSEAHRKRLKAHLRLGVDQPATLASLKKKLEPLPADAKRSIVRFLAHLTQTDGKVTPEEVKFLERVYKMLGIESQQVYSDLHVQAATGAPAAAPAFGVSVAPAESSGFTLDAERIAQLQKETEAVSALLANVFAEEAPVEAAADEVAPAEALLAAESGVLGLDHDHSAFLRRLIGRHVWPRDELADIAADMELMLDGALEHINEIILDSFEAPLAEGDDPIEINQELLEKLPL
ncbi:MAG: Tellurite resistance protein TerB [Betaproteobacteria bacterium HGW-Betaproteobacteria-4]|nr:MAG: Tellurite resistance protein TerB [Betaproteobacteria bacterium HGW-Betaproteobacteria-4]